MNNDKPWLTSIGDPSKVHHAHVCTGGKWDKYMMGFWTCREAWPTDDERKSIWCASCCANKLQEEVVILLEERASREG